MEKLDKKEIKDEVLVIRISELYLKPFKAKCKENGESMSKVIRRLIKEYLAR